MQSPGSTNFHVYWGGKSWYTLEQRVSAKNRNFFEYLWENSINKRNSSLRKVLKVLFIFRSMDFLRKGYTMNYFTTYTIFNLLHEEYVWYQLVSFPTIDNDMLFSQILIILSIVVFYIRTYTRLKWNFNKSVYQLKYIGDKLTHEKLQMKNVSFIWQKRHEWVVKRVSNI